MTAWTSEEEQRRRRRRSIVRGLAIGGAAIGLPALLNASISRRARKAPAAQWGRRHRYAWELGDVVFQRVGEGDPLVLLHSFGPGHDSVEWRALAERLGDRHQLFAPDLPGWGGSERPSLDYDAELYIEFLIDFLNVFPPEGVVNARVIVSPGHLKRMIRALTDNLGRYEGKFGPIVEASAPDPETPTN